MVNKVILIGNLGKDPEIRYIANGTAICNFSLATSRSWKDKQSNEKKQETEWHSVECWGKLAEIAEENLEKGRQVYVEGRIKTEKWQDKKTGADRYRTKIVAESITFLGGKGDRTSSRGGTGDRGGGSGGDEEPAPGFDPVPSGDDDIPF